MKLLAGQFGNITSPFNVLSPAGSTLRTAGAQGQGLIILLNSLIKLVIVIAGVYTLWNLIIAGYQFINAGGEPKNVAKAWEKIWQSIVGLMIVAGSFVLAMVFGWLIFGDPTILINPTIFSP